MALALPELLWLCALFMALGLIVGGKAFTDSLVWIIKSTVGKVPLIGGVFAKPAEAALQKLSHELGGLANAVGGDISRSWHFLATITDRLGWTIFHLGVALNRLYYYVTLGYPLHVLWATAKRAEALALRAAHTVGGSVQITKIVRQTITLPARSPLAPAIRAITKPLAAELHAFETWTRHAIAASGGVAADAVAVPVKVGYTAKQLRRLGSRLSWLEYLTVGAGAAAMVATALGRLGLGWLRCDSLRRLGRNVGCSGWAALEELLAPAVEALVVLDLCRFALGAQKLVRTFVPELGLVILAADAICLGGGASLPSAADAPTLSARITLPSASG